jgi:hypothetical protein
VFEKDLHAQLSCFAPLFSAPQGTQEAFAVTKNKD